MSNPVLAFADTSIEVKGRALRVRVYGKRRAGAAVPLVVHFHGGAFVDGDLESGECMAQLLVEAGANVVSVAYPLAPEHRFPDAVEAGYAALEWTYKNRAKLAGTGAPVYLAGDEAGGNLAAAIALVARDRAHPPLAGQILVAPMLDPCVGTASLRESMPCDTTGCKWAEGWQQYLRGPMDAEHPYAVPGKATRLAGLPPALVLTGCDDPMRDEAMQYADRLRAAGIEVTGEVLRSQTDWPESLAERNPDECPCASEVREHLRAFFQPALAPSG
ncbi:alpha/beta hydrolase [Ramlibacter sp. PS4R-6]|uniref:alpha/beta hydrolase n=1 Tax=Ramlibacter sp. PS4R-6 TaxID=3133438 RepID=UPI0030974EAC